MDTFRLFIALDPPDEVKDALRGAQDKLRAVLRDHTVRWTRPEQMHLTLRFLGNVPGGDVEALKMAVTQACSGFTSIPLRAEGIGFFPPKGHPRVIWVGIGVDSDRLSALAKSIQEAAAPFTTEPAEKVFQPHFTLGRCKTVSRTQARSIVQFAQTIGTITFGSWVAGSVVIVRSEPSAAGHRHSELTGIPLC